MERTLRVFLVIFIMFSHASWAEVAKSSSAKTFAVFAISYNEDNDLVVGGVMGAAFFISETKAVTAFHVLQPDSFKPNPGFQHKKVFLLHENETPIEVKPSNAKFLASRDQTLIRLAARARVSRRLIYEIETSVRAEANVSTEGFEANSSGPIIVREGRHMKITEVPTLRRRELRGMILRKANIQLAAADVHLNRVSCLQLSYMPIVGFSGGPVLSSRGRVVAMNSFAEPVTRARTWAVSLTRNVGLPLF